RVSGQKRSAHRGTIPPWLWPMIEILLSPSRAYIVRIALTTYSPAIWTSASPFSGSATVHQGILRSSRAGSQFQEKLCSGLLPVPCTSRIGVLAASSTGFAVEHSRLLSRSAWGGLSGGPA